MSYFKPGDLVTLRNEQRTIYRIHKFDVHGDVHMYGGDVDPKGRQGWRVVRPLRLKAPLKRHLPKGAK